MAHVIQEFHVTYCDFGGEKAAETIEVRHDTDINGKPGDFYGFNVNLGCGKNAPTAEEAVRRLVRDHSTLIYSIQPL